MAQPGRHVAQKSGLNKSILDQNWCEFDRQLQYKMNWHGGIVLKVPAYHTSQTCSSCGKIDAAARTKQSDFNCTSCGHMENPDTNAARNIRQRGLGILVSENRPVPYEVPYEAGTVLPVCGDLSVKMSKKQKKKNDSSRQQLSSVAV